MREHVFYIYLKRNNEFGNPLTPEDYIMAYRKPLRRAMIQNHDQARCITWDGRLLQVTEALSFLKRAEKQVEKDFFQRCFSKQDFIDYVNEYPRGNFIKEATEMIERLEYNSCLDSTDYRRSLKKYANSKYASQSQRRSAKAKAVTA